MKKISVVVPVYNVEKYLSKCIDSILKQTFRDFELILVDDGSTDSSGEICEEYAAKDDRIYVIHKENEGLSSARNKGIDASTGEYISLIDSDDFISENMLEALYSSIKKHNADMSMCRVVDCYGSIPKVENEKLELVYDMVDGLREILRAKLLGLWAINKLYKRELFNEVKYPVGKIYEDSFVIVDLLVQCKRVVYTGEGQYYYIHRANSITTNSFSDKFFDVIEAWNKNNKTIEERCPELQRLARLRGCWARFTVLDKMVLSKTRDYQKERKEIISYLRKNSKLILTAEYFNIPRKVSMALLLVSSNFYSIPVKINDRRNRRIYE